MTPELNALTAAFNKLIEGRELDGEASRRAFSIKQQLLRAGRIVKRGKPLDAISRKMILEDIDRLTELLSIPKNGEA